jgi:hypothetical protein
MGHHTQASASGASQAGITSSSADLKSIKPGTWPKNHGRAVALDEMQTFFDTRKAPLLEALQSARSDGYVDSAKCTGDSRMPAAVRAIFISNFPKSTGQYPCESLLKLFVTPEGVSRMDFPLMVTDQVRFQKAGVPHVYRLPLIKTVVQRAWSQTTDEVNITPEAFDEAERQCEAWEDVYDSEDLPLFSGNEKAESVLRIAIGVANLVFSHSTEDASLRTVEVRKVHVQWASRWLEYCWQQAGYRDYSDAIKRSHRVKQPLKMQAILTGGLEDPQMVEASLRPMLEAADLRTYPMLVPGDGWQDQQRMFRLLSNHNVIQTYKDRTGAQMVRLTHGGKEMISRIIQLANENEDLYEKAQQRWQQWKTDPMSMSAPPDFSDPNEFDLFLQNEGMW